LSQGSRRLAAIMFTDMVGYTALGQRNEELSLALAEEQKKLVRPIFSRHNGREIKTMGDAFLIEFPSALDAVRSAYDIQRGVREYNISQPAEQRIHLRIGVHLGDVVESGGDISGDAVNVASRIEPLAEDGGVCLTRQVYDQAKGKLEIPFVSLGAKSLKNVKETVEVYRMAMPWETGTKRETELDTKRVAVLPLRNMSPDPNDEYFADGMTEELITALSSVTELTVIARTSVMQYKGSSKRIVDIGRELNAGTMIEGSVRKAANKVRITVQLIDARNEGHLWAQNYDKTLEDVFAIQSEVAQKVAESLKVRLLETDRKKIEKGFTRNAEAHTLYLKGVFYWNKRTPEALQKAVELYEQAIRLDPTFALGYAGIALAYGVTAANYSGDPLTYYPKAKEYALKALSLDDDLPEAHAVLATVIEGYERDLVGAEAEFKRAIELNPSYPSAHQWYSHILQWEKRSSEAWEQLRKALDLNPLSLIVLINMADYHWFMRDYDKAIEYAKKAIELDPAFVFNYDALIRGYVGKSMFNEALQASDAYSKVARPVEGQLWRAYVLASMGKAEECHQLLDNLDAQYKEKSVSPYGLAIVHFRLGEADRGFEWLQTAYDSYDRYLFVIAVTPDLDGYREDPRYFALLERTGLSKLLPPN